MWQWNLRQIQITKKCFKKLNMVLLDSEKKKIMCTRTLCILCNLVYSSERERCSTDGKRKYHVQKMYVKCKRIVIEKKYEFKTCCKLYPLCLEFARIGRPVELKFTLFKTGMIIIFCKQSVAWFMAHKAGQTIKKNSS